MKLQRQRHTEPKQKHEARSSKPVPEENNYVTISRNEGKEQNKIETSLRSRADDVRKSTYDLWTT